MGRSPAEIAFELHLLRECRSPPGIDVARPICTADGMDCARLVFEDAARTACLFQALDGRTITYEPEDVALFGSALAKLHHALAGIAGGDTRPLDPQTLSARAAAYLMSIPGSEAVRHAIARCCAALFDDPAARNLPLGNRHGDAWPADAVVRGGTVGFFDFDDCSYGPYLLDLGTAVMHLSLREPMRTEILVTALLGRLRNWSRLVWFGAAGSPALH